MTRPIGLGGALVLALATTALAAPQTTGPSFDCTKASGQVEELVCRDPALAALDRKMADVFASAMKSWPANIAAEQRAYQRGWIKGRNDCWKDSDPRACTEREYKSRIVELQIKSGQLLAPDAVGYECKPDPGHTFFATFYQETDPPSAVLTSGDDQVIAFVEPSGSGAKYAAANVERDLGYVRSYVMKDGHLFLSLMADGGIYEFAPEMTEH